MLIVTFRNTYLITPRLLLITSEMDPKSDASCHGRTLKRWFTHLFQQIIVINCSLDYNYVLYAGLVVQIVNSSQARLLNHVQHGVYYICCCLFILFLSFQSYLKLYTCDCLCSSFVFPLCSVYKVSQCWRSSEGEGSLISDPISLEVFGW